MNLEMAEQKSIKFLKEVSNPLVPVAVLLRHLHEEAELASLSERDLLEFLRKHELFTVIESMAGADGPVTRELEALGVQTGPRVILCTRVPTPEQLTEHMGLELEKIREALVSALLEAKEQKDEDKMQRIQQLMKRTEEIKNRIC